MDRTQRRGLAGSGIVTLAGVILTLVDPAIGISVAVLGGVAFAWWGWGVSSLGPRPGSVRLPYWLAGYRATSGSITWGQIGTEGDLAIEQFSDVGLDTMVARTFGLISGRQRQPIHLTLAFEQREANRGYRILRIYERR